MALYKKVNGMLVKINSGKKYVYGSKDKKWHLVGPEDRDYDKGLTKEELDRKDPDGSKVNSAMDDALKYVRKQIKLGDDKASAVRSAVSNFGLTPYEKDDLMNRISGMY